MLILLSGHKNSGKSLCSSFLTEQGWHSISFGKALKDLIEKVYGLDKEERSWLDGRAPADRAWKERKSSIFSPASHELQWQPQTMLEVVENYLGIEDKLSLFHGCQELEQLLREYVYPFSFSPREALQTIGTEVFRGLYEDVWVDYLSFTEIDSNGEDIPTIYELLNQGKNVVVTDCRFANEALWGKDMGGKIIYIERCKDDFDSHKSEDLEKIKSLADFILVNDNSALKLKENLWNCLESL